MDEHITKSMAQIRESVELTQNQADIVKLVLEKVYLLGQKEGWDKAFVVVKNSFKK